MNKYRWLEITEYVSLISSVAGSFAAIVFGNIIYVAAPLSLSILLNLVYRHRFERQFQQSQNAAIIDTQQQLSSDIRSLHSSISTLFTQEELSKHIEEITTEQIEIKNILTRLKNEITVEKTNSELIHNNISQLLQQIATLQEFLDGLVGRMLADGILGGHLSSNDRETRIGKIIQQYMEQKRQRLKSYEMEM